MIELETRGAVRILHLREDQSRFNRSTVDAIDGAIDQVAAVDGPVSKRIQLEIESELVLNA